MEPKAFSREFMQALRSYDWSGNVRELFNTIESAFLAAGDAPTLFTKHLPEALRIRLARRSFREDPPGRPQGAISTATTEALPSLREFRETTVSVAEKEYLRKEL